jgi:hypothetical protein
VQHLTPILHVQHAHEKLVQAQRYFMAAQVMRQADHSGRLGPLSGGGAPQSPSHPPVSPPAAPGPSGGLGTDGSEVTQWTSRTHDNSLSAVAQSYMSTQNMSGTASGVALLCWQSCLCSQTQM